MAASYPSSTKSFTTKLAGQTIASAHVNEIQDEIVAVENGLLTGVAHGLKPSSSGGQDLGTSSLPWGRVYANNLSGGLIADQVQGRLTLTSATPVTTADVTAATTLYFALYGGNRIALYDGSTTWNVRTFTELSIAVPATTSQMYDVFVYDNAGTPALELTAWTNDTTRATALTKQDGVLVKTGATTRRFVGCMRTTGVSGQTEDSLAKRYVWNYYNRVDRPIRVSEATNTWTYAVNAWQQANNAAANQVDVIVGVAEVMLRLRVDASAGSSGSTGSMPVGIGEDGISGPVSGCVMQTYTNAGSSATAVPVSAALEKYPAVGRHYYTWIEKSPASITITYYGDNGVDYFQSAIHGFIQG